MAPTSTGFLCQPSHSKLLPDVENRSQVKLSTWRICRITSRKNVQSTDAFNVKYLRRVNVYAVGDEKQMKNRTVRQNLIGFTPISIKVHWAKPKDKPITKFFETLRKEPAAPTSEDTEWVDRVFHFYYFPSDLFCTFYSAVFVVLLFSYYFTHKNTYFVYRYRTVEKGCWNYTRYLAYEVGPKYNRNYFCKWSFRFYTVTTLVSFKVLSF